MIPKLTNEQLLGEIEELLRTIPSGSSFGTYGTESLSWLGRATAVIEAWDALKGTIFRIAVQNFNQRQTTDNLADIITTLHQARQDLRMKTVGPVNVAIGSGKAYDYFDEVRKILET